MSERSEGDALSDNILSVIPTDPYWQPGRDAADRAAALAAELAPGDLTEVKASFHDTVTVVDCGANLSRIGCPGCGAEIDTGWWGDLLEERVDAGFDDLTVTVPCCGAATALPDLPYDWPCGFARFEIEIWNPDRDWFSEAEMAALAAALGHPVTQVLAHL